MDKQIAVNDIYYSCYISIEPVGEKSSIELNEWHVTTINKNGIYITQKNEFTFGKLSEKNGDIGWLKMRKGSYWHKHFSITEKLQGDNDLFSTKKKAYTSVLADAKKYKRDASSILTRLEKYIAKEKK